MRAHIQLLGEGLRLRKRSMSGREVACQELDLPLLAEELGVLIGVRLDLGLARLKQALGFFDLVLLGEEPCEGAAEGAGGGRKGLVADRDGISKVGLGGEQIALGKQEVTEVSENDALISTTAHLASNRYRLLVVLQRLRDAALLEMEEREVSEGDALASALPHLASNRQGLVVVLQGRNGLVRLGPAQAQRLAREAMRLMERRGEEVTRTKLAAELGVARARLDAVFPEEGDLLEAVTGEWFAPKLAVMDEVMASGLPPRRKMYEFIARRFLLLRQNYRDDPATFNLYVEMGERYFEYARSYIDLADHYLCELIAEAQAEGYLQGLEVDTALSLINQMVNCYLQPYMIAMIDERLSEEKLALIVGAIFDGLNAKDGGAGGTQDIRAA